MMIAKMTNEVIRTKRSKNMTLIYIPICFYKSYLTYVLLLAKRYTKNTLYSSHVATRISRCNTDTVVTLMVLIEWLCRSFLCHDDNGREIII